MSYSNPNDGVKELEHDEVYEKFNAIPVVEVKTKFVTNYNNDEPDDGADADTHIHTDIDDDYEDTTEDEELDSDDDDDSWLEDVDLDDLDNDD